MEFKCKACNYTAKDKDDYINHLSTNLHVRKSYRYQLLQSELEEFNNQIDKLKKEKDGLEVKNANILNTINNMISDYNNLKISSEQEIETLKNKIKELENENINLKNNNDSNSLESVDPDTSPYAISNYSKEHETYRSTFERLLGMRPLVWVNKGETHNSLFGMLRSSYQLNYNSWKIYKEHITTYNINPRITIGIPIINTSSDKLSPVIFYMKFHLYIDKETKHSESLCGFDGNTEFEIVKYNCQNSITK